MARALVATMAALFAGVGVWALVDPVGMLGHVGVEAPGPEGRIELRAMYGGLELGFAAWLASTLRDPARTRDALLAAGLAIGGLGATRLVCLFAEDPAPGLHHAFAAAELTGAALCVSAYARRAR